MLIDSGGGYGKCIQEGCKRKIPLAQEYCREHEKENPIKKQQIQSKILSRIKDE